ncbi:hypothetical protein J2Z32_003339 [Paenibacillus turicensis]|uniref:B30.2/SPRY domain-containing protein n=1 Tax=Paenibacillus turicensis TaxID=160487 RepID=A0ABS4FVT5_9BACL|nr:SPRY domain-containing protein [Paenibacillus turicensis]MBP1906675.1 hypothetical protein [Paenibacillus turicensis]
MEIIDVTLNPNDMGSGKTLSNSNLTVTSTSGSSIRATHGKSTGKWYWEVKLDSGGTSSAIGVSNKSFGISSVALSTSAYRRAYYTINGYKLPENTPYGSSTAVGNIIGVALDLDNGTLEFYKNGVSMGISHTNVKELGEVEIYPTLSTQNATSTVFTVNFGVTPFVYSIPHKFYSYDGRQYGSVNKILISSENDFYSVVPEVIGIETAIPNMTSNTTPSGRAFASSIYGSGREPWRAFSGSEYISAQNTSSGHIGYEFLNKIKIGKYALSSSGNHTYAPKDWTFEGSNDGTIWTVLDTQVNQTWTAIGIEKEYIIEVSKVNKYKIYRLNWTANNGGGTYTRLSLFKMYKFTSGKIIKLSNNSEQTFINHGMNKETSIDLTTSKILERTYIVQDNTQLGSGKVFMKKIDTAKIPIRNAVID